MRNLLILFILFFATRVVAQTISGPASTVAGQTYAYSFTSTSLYVDPLWDAATFGTVLTETKVGSTYTATVRWNTVGTGTVKFKNGGATIASKSVTITAPPSPSTSVIQTLNCNATVVRRTSSPSSDYDWYWQTSSTGTSTTLGKLDSVVITSAGSLYLRTRTKFSPYAWSTSSLSIGTISVTSPPSAPTSSTNGNTITNTSGSVTVSVGGASQYWWYTQSSGGSKIPGVTSNQYTTTVSTNTNFYVASVVGNCPSVSRRIVTAYVHPEPQISATSSVLSMGTQSTLSVQNYAYDSYQWLDRNNNVIGTSQTTLIRSAGEYRVKVIKGNSSWVTSQKIGISGSLDNLNLNYVITNRFYKPGLQVSELDTVSVNSRSQEIEYFDGLGRSIQNVYTQASPNRKDIVQPIAYDPAGRVARTYLPYTSNENTGRYKLSAISLGSTYLGSEQHSFYQSADDIVANDTSPYAVRVYEKSPISRVIKEGSFGTVWQPDGDSTYNSQDHTTKILTDVNSNHEVIQWTYVYPTAEFQLGLLDGGTNSSIRYYAGSELLKEMIRDEQGNESWIYKDKMGRKLLSRHVAESDTIDVYFIYDDLGNLISEIQPEGVRRFGEYFQLNDSAKDKFLEKWAFRYRWDRRRRMVIKQVPGSAAEYRVYNDSDQIILSQDGNQRILNKWIFTKYDGLDRPIIQGIYTHNEPVSQSEMATLIGSIAASERYNGNTSFFGYSNTSFPTQNADGTPIEVHNVTYYDNYKFRIDLANGMYEFSGTDISGQDNTYQQRMSGYVTGVLRNVIGTNDYLWGVNYYDSKYRKIQMVNETRTGGVERVTNIFDSFGKVLTSKTSYVKGTSVATVNRRYQYDHSNRLLRAFHKLNDEPEVVLSVYDRNEVGQLVKKRLHANGSESYKQQIDYRYNIRGWLTRINDSNLSDSNGGPRDFFGIEFGYNNDIGVGVFAPRFDGNLSAAKWSSDLGLGWIERGESTERAYTYFYDHVGRVSEASHKVKSTSWSSTSAFKEKIRYDHNGNILELYRSDENGTPVDWLIYDYGSVPIRDNKLRSISDHGFITKSYRDYSSANEDFLYDFNGNFIVDKNKNIDSIQYNLYLNAAQQIVHGNGDKIKYILDSDGVKLAEEIYSESSVTPIRRFDYIGPFVFENDTLRAVSHDEGNVVISKEEPEGIEYQYQLRDHLGNIRLTFTTKEKSSILKATMEDNGLSDYSNPRVIEMMNFGNLFETEIRNVNQWLNHTSSGNGNAIYLDGSTEKSIGPYTMLKVYPGDTVHIETFGKFENNANYSSMSLIDLVGALVVPLQSTLVGLEGGPNVTSSSLANSLGSFWTNRSNSDSAPGAYLNYIFFDENFNLLDFGYDRIDVNSGFATNAENTVSFDRMALSRIVDHSGYVYIYVSNESPGTRVWMDDIKVTYCHSPIVQYEDYYPFGLSMSATAFNRSDDEYKGMVTPDGNGLRDLGFRQYDAGTGRFYAVDPLAELSGFETTYQFADNDPVNRIDLLGLEGMGTADDDDKNNKKKANNRSRQKKKQRIRVEKGYSRYKARKTNTHLVKGGKTHGTTDGTKSGSGPIISTGTSAPVYNPSNYDGSVLVRLDLLNVNQYPFGGRREEQVNYFTTQGRIDNILIPHYYETQKLSTSSARLETRRDGVPPVIASIDPRQVTAGDEMYRRYLYSNLSIIEARALYQRSVAVRDLTSGINDPGNRFLENQKTTSYTAPNVFSVGGPTDPVKVKLSNGGISLSHDNVVGILKQLSVSVKREDDLEYHALEVTVDEADFNGDSPELMQIFKRGAEYALTLLKDEEQRIKTQENREGFTGPLEIKQFLLSKQAEIESYMDELRNEVTTNGISDYVGIPESEKQAISTSMNKFKNQFGIDSEVKILDKEFFDRLRKQFDDGTRQPEKDVTMLMTIDPNGNIEKHIVYKDGFYVPPTEKLVTRPDGTLETIQLEGTMEEIGPIRDYYIDRAIENNSLAVGKDAAGNPILIDSEEEPVFNVFEKAMWVIEVVKDFMDEAEIGEKRWNVALDENDWPWDVPSYAAGPGNAALDEAKSLPQMITFGCSMLEEEQREAVADALKSIDLGTVTEMIKEKADRYTSNNPDVVRYEATYDGTTVTIIILTGGGELIKKILDIKNNLGVLKRLDWTDIDLPYDEAQKLGADAASSSKLADALADNVDLAKGWKSLDDIGVEEVIRKNPDYLKNLDDFSKRTGSSTDEIAEDLAKFDDGPEQFLDELEDTPASGHWDKNPFQRGKDIEDDLGQNLPETFKTIDKYDFGGSGKATSIKSLDLDAKTYQDATKLRSRLNKYVDQLDGFTGHTQEGINIGGLDNPILLKELELVIPRAATGEQLNIINAVIANASGRGINVNVVVLP